MLTGLHRAHSAQRAHMADWGPIKIVTAYWGSRWPIGLKRAPKGSLGEKCLLGSKGLIRLEMSHSALIGLKRTHWALVHYANWAHGAHRTQKAHSAFKAPLISKGLLDSKGHIGLKRAHLSQKCSFDS